MRSDSFARAETLLKEYRLFNNFHTESVNMQNNQAHESKETISRGFEIHKTESEDAGLLTIVDQSGSFGDSLESHIHSLADVSSLHGSPTTNKTVQVNLVSSDTPIINTMISTTNSTPNQSPNAWQSSVQVCRILHCFFTSSSNFCFLMHSEIFTCLKSRISSSSFAHYTNY